MRFEWLHGDDQYYVGIYLDRKRQVFPIKLRGPSERTQFHTVAFRNPNNETENSKETNAQTGPSGGILLLQEHTLTIGNSSKVTALEKGLIIMNHKEKDDVNCDGEIAYEFDWYAPPEPWRKMDAVVLKRAVDHLEKRHKISENIQIENRLAKLENMLETIIKKLEHKQTVNRSE